MKDLTPTKAERILIDAGYDAAICEGLMATRSRADQAPLADARDTITRFRSRYGYTSRQFKLLTPPDANAKLRKTERPNYGLTLTPNRTLDVSAFDIPKPLNLCPWASKGCANACLNYSGHGSFNKTQFARQVRCASLFTHPREFGLLLGAELQRLSLSHGSFLFRPNVVSDLRIELVMPMALRALSRLRGCRVYDYTAWPMDKRDPYDANGIKRLFHLTYSAKESAHTSDAYLASVLMAGNNVAMPFAVDREADLPKRYTLNGDSFRVINGTASDDRTDDPEGVIVGLVEKKTPGRKTDTTGFIRPIQ